MVQFRREIWIENAFSLFVRHGEQPSGTKPVVFPSLIFRDRVQANTGNGNSAGHRRTHLRANIVKP
jgi:hypothetical protein